MPRLAQAAAVDSSTSTISKEAKEVSIVVENSVNSVLEVLKNKELEKEDRKQKVLALIDPVFDLPLMGKLVLGPTYWPKLSVPQRKEFIALFIKAIHDSYFEKIDLFTNETVDFEAPAPGEKGKYEMATRINSKGQRYKLLYKLYRSGNSWKIYDMEIEGISLIRTYGAQYDQVIQKSSIKGLLAKMKEKAMEIPDELKAAAKREAKPAPEASPAGKP